jgi:hypothetical protein
MGEGTTPTGFTTLFPDGGSPHTGIVMRITCLVGLGPRHGFEDGTTVDRFTEHTGGLTLFHID